MKGHMDLLNLIAEKIGAKSYLEIGIFNPDHNFNLIKVENKVGVDPDPNAKATYQMESDDFFAAHGEYYDLVLCDGLHHASQVKRDLINAWGQLNKGGCILVHDANPPTEATTCVPRGKQAEWCGSVYKTICQIISPDFFTMDMDYGCVVIRRGDLPLSFHSQEITWKIFDKSRELLLNLRSVEDGTKIINSWTS